MGLIGIFGLFDIEPELYAAADILHPYSMRWSL